MPSRPATEPLRLPPAAHAWFCLRSQPKHEHIAAAHLVREPDVEVFLPRVSFRRPSRSGPMWVTEAMFPNYLFARFNWHTSLRKVTHARGVRGVVHFGDRWPTIPDAVLDELRRVVGDRHVHVIPEELEPGTPVRIAGGLFHGLTAVVTRAMPGRDRVAVLLEFLGRQTLTEVDRHALVPAESDQRALLLPAKTRQSRKHVVRPAGLKPATF